MSTNKIKIKQINICVTGNLIDSLSQRNTALGQQPSNDVTKCLQSKPANVAGKQTKESHLAEEPIEPLAIKM